MEYIRAGDTVVIWKLDRLGRLHILETVKALADRGDAGLDHRRHRLLHARRRIMIGVLGSLAEYEREPVKAHTALNRQASRARGNSFGRHSKVKGGGHIAASRAASPPTRSMSR